MNGKRGENPPLPRNCERLLRSAISHCPIGWEGAGQWMCVASQETGPSAYLRSALPRAKEDVMHPVRHALVRGFILLLLYFPLRIPAFASSPGTLRGRVLDPLGAAVANADVTLMRDAKPVSATHTNAEGLFEFAVSDSDRYTVRVEASGFEKQESSAIFVRAGSTVSLEVLLQIGSISQKIVVSATGSETPDAQVGGFVSVIDHSQLEDLDKLDVLEALRTVPGIQGFQSVGR